MLGQSTEFALRYNEIMGYVLPAAQLLYWLVIGFAAVWAAMLLKRFVDLQASKDPDGRAHASGDEREAGAGGSGPAEDEDAGVV